MGSELPQRADQRPGALSPERRSGFVTLLFTDVVGSTALKQELGDRPAVDLLQAHHRLVRETLGQFPGAKEVDTAGDSFFLTFPTPSEAVTFALRLQERLRQFNRGRTTPVQDRIGLHLGEVVMAQTGSASSKPQGMQVDTCARVMSLAQGGQILLTRSVFDNARQSLKGEEVPGLGERRWLNHGPFQLKGIEEAMEICEVYEVSQSSIPSPPTTSEKAHKVSTPEEPVLGWRPAVGQVVSNTQWVLEQKLGEGGFGEVWLGRHQTMKERRVFKFCFRADRVRSLKREMTLFRLIKERIGDHPHIVSLREVYFDQPPFYVEMDYVAGQDLASWCAAQGGAEKVPLATKLEIAAQMAEALQAAHGAGVIHRDVKPGNILVSNPKSEIRNATEIRDPKSEVGKAQRSTFNAQPVAKLTDFGIGQVVSQEYLAGVTKAGFTQTLLGLDRGSPTGTHLYMAPELLAGNPASTRSDIYSLGVVLYQLMVGDLKRPLATDWAEEVADPLLREDIGGCVAGKPERRFSSARQLAERLRTLPRRRADLAVRHRYRLARAAVIVIGLVALTVAGAFAWLHYTHIRWAKNQAVPEVERLTEQARLASDYAKFRQAFELGQRASRYLPEDPRLKKAVEACSGVWSVKSDPPGVRASIKPYDKQEADWRVLGQTPLQNIRLPPSFFVVRFEKTGYEPVEAVDGFIYGGGVGLSRRLDPTGTIPPGMVRIPGRKVAGLGEVPDFFIDKYEVTNRRFKEFVDAGGYQKPQYWKQAFIRDGQALAWDAAVSLFRDSKGRPGPATWVSGSYPAGRADYPVSGVSWYEAAAYAEFAGKNLPTKDHWAWSAGIDREQGGFPALIGRFSNFHQDGPAAVGSHKGMNPFGALDMAGNVREWCWNESPGGRFIRGGAWDNAMYMYVNESQQSPWDRSPQNGFRCVLYPDRGKLPASLFEPKGLRSMRDFGKEQPVDNAVFELYKAKFEYDRTELKAVLEERDQSAANWVRDRVTFEAAYDNERVIVQLYLPRNGRKPYQSVIFFPGGSAVGATAADMGWIPALFDFFLKSGRAFAFPVYKGTYERTGDMTEAKRWPTEEYRHAYTEHLAKWVKDFRRCVDYLESRPDFDRQKIAYCGASWGGIMGAIIPAVEPRIRVNILVLGGFEANYALPEAQGLNYIQHIKTPTLMLNGKYDMVFPLETCVRPAFKLLQLPDADKRLVVYETDHYLPKGELIKESLAWLDKYFGPAK